MSYVSGVRGRQSDAESSTTASLDAALDALADRRRREILSVLRPREEPVSESDLATNLVARAEDKPLLYVTGPEHKRVLAKLHHVHLPKLAAAGLIRHVPDRRSVSAAAHSILDHAAFDALLRRDEDPADPDALDPAATDAVLSALADERRRTVISVLKDAGRRDSSERSDLDALDPSEDGDALDPSENPDALDLSEVAERVAAREGEGSEDAVTPEDAVTRVETRLYHVHAPKLADAGLVDYDPNRGSVVPADPPGPAESWVEAALDASDASPPFEAEIENEPNEDATATE